MCKYENPPAILIVHCAGNDIGRRPVGDLRRILKSEIQTILSRTIIFVPRFYPDDPGGFQRT